ncbi:hypothetical protein L596_004638 [Steinernema carpocapsae]|uniref:Uncharacterized protein n=1 Tax=Steinernema carpocapsae TaxID=34508 RepID=A0A4U8UWJ2_STECR|nr:hypothetical protein L596_004638 [Steinernema carpocapsae]
MSGEWISAIELRTAAIVFGINIFVFSAHQKTPTWMPGCHIGEREDHSEIWLKPARWRSVSLRESSSPGTYVFVYNQEAFERTAEFRRLLPKRSAQQLNIDAKRPKGLYIVRDARDRRKLISGQFLANLYGNGFVWMLARRHENCVEFEQHALMRQRLIELLKLKFVLKTLISSLSGITMASEKPSSLRTVYFFFRY